MVGGLSLFVAIVWLEDTPPTETGEKWKKTEEVRVFAVCPSFGCLLIRFPSQYLGVPKSLAGLTSVCLSFVFWRKLAKHQQQFVGNQRNFRQVRDQPRNHKFLSFSANLIAAMAVVTEVGLNFVPFFVWSVLSAYGVEQWK